MKVTGNDNGSMTIYDIHTKAVKLHVPIFKISEKASVKSIIAYRYISQWR